SRTRSPRSRMAARCGPRATSTVSTPACVRRAPRKPPVAPAPTIAIRIASAGAGEGGRHMAALHLAGGGARDLVDDVDGPRHLELGQPLAAPGGELLLGHRLAGDHRHRHLL